MTEADYIFLIFFCLVSMAAYVVISLVIDSKRWREIYDLREEVRRLREGGDDLRGKP